MSDNIESVLQTKQQVGERVPSKTVNKRAKQTQAPQKSLHDILEANKDKANWEWVEVPDTDLFGETHPGVSVNFEQFGPGKYFLSPELAGEVQRLLNCKVRADIRVLQPKQDVAMAHIMSKSQLGAPTNNDLRGLNDKD